MSADLVRIAYRMHSLTIWLQSTSGPTATLVDALLRSADQQVSKLTEAISAGLKQDPRGIVAFKDALLAVLEIWSAQVRLRSETSHSGERDCFFHRIVEPSADAFPSDLCLWVDHLLSTALIHIQSFQAEVNAAAIARVLLKLLVLRAESVSRDITTGGSGQPGAFDSVLAYHLAFQSALPRQSELRLQALGAWKLIFSRGPADWSQLDEVLAAAVVSTTVPEYERALQAVDSLLGSLATSELSTAEAARLLDQLLSTMYTLLLSGPEGESKRTQRDQSGIELTPALPQDRDELRQARWPTCCAILLRSLLAMNPLQTRR